MPSPGWAAFAPSQSVSMEAKPSQEKEPPEEEEAALSSGGEGCSVRGLLPCLEAESPTETVVRIIQAARNCPSAVMPALLVLIQQEEAPVGQKVMVHHSLRTLLDNGLEVEPTRGFIAAATRQLRAPLEPQEGPRELQVAASHTLASLARRHFNLVMTELQRHLRPFVQPDEFTLLTLGRMAAGNVYSCVPFLGLTLATLQTAVRWIEDGRRRRALCTALEQMCQAIRVYLRSWEKTSYPRISLQRFSRCLFPLYAYLARKWLPGSDAQVKVAVLKVLGPVLSLLLPKREFQVQIYQDLLLFSEQFQSGLDPVLLAKIVSQILEASLANQHPVPRLLVQPLARTLSQQICTWRAQKHNRECCAEISRIFRSLAHSHPTELLRAFQGKLQEGLEDVRVTLLLLISEITGTEGPEVPSRRRLCVKVVKAVLGDDRARVRLATLRGIGTLLRMGYLEKVDGWPLNYVSLQLAVSGHQLAHPSRSLPLGGLEEKAIEREAVEVLHTAVVSERGLSQELWRRLLGYVVQPHLTTSAVPLCQALRLLAEQRLQRALRAKRQWEPVESPTPQEILARLLSLAVSPLEGSGRGTAVLLLLNALHPEVYQDVAERWWMEVPVLVRYLEGHSKYTLEAGAWEQMLLEFLKKSLEHLQQSRSSPEEGDGWLLALGKEVAKQMHLAPSSSTEKVFLCKALGMTLSLPREKAAQGVTLQLSEFLMQTDYTDEGQRKGARWCLAFCAEGGLPPVLGALSLFEREALPSLKSQEGSACLHSSQGPPETARVRNSLLMLYSSLALRASRQQVGPHLEVSIVPGILRHYLASTPLERAQDTDLALSFAQSVMEVSLSVQGEGEPLALRRPQKRAFLDHLVGLIQARSSEALGSPVCQQVLLALQHLSRVPEPLSHEEKVELAQRCLSHVMALPPPKLSGGAVQALYAGTFSALAGLLGTLLAHPSSAHPGSEWVQQVFQLLGYWLASEHEWERARAMQVVAQVLKAHGQGSGSRPSGHLLGALAPFTGDTLATIRQGARKCIGALLLRTAGTTEATGRATERRLRCVHRGLRSDSASQVRLASLHLAKVVSRALPSEEIQPFLQALLEQLRTVSPACDRTALLWFEVATREREVDLRDQVHEVAAFICSCLQWAEDFSLRAALAQAFGLLAKHHRKVACDALVAQPLLQPRARRELWVSLVAPQESQTPILKQLLRRLKVEGNSATSCVPVLLALREVLWALDEDNGAGLSPPLLSDLCYALLCQLSQDPSGEGPEVTAASGSVLDRDGDREAGRAGPRGLAVDVLQATLRRAVPEAAWEMEAQNAWAFLEEPESYLWGVSSLARVLARSENHVLGRILHHLLPSLHSSGALQDLTLAFCVELTSHPGLRRRPKTLGLLFRQWLAMSQEEGDPALRALSVRALGNVVEGAPQEARKLEEALLTALLQGVDDHSGPELARESLTALGKVWGGFGRRHAGHTLQAVASQAHRHLGHPDEALRTAAFELLGRMAGATRPAHAKAFAREAGGNLAALLLHLRDPSPDVAQACCTAFLSCAPFLGLQDLQEETEASLLPADPSGAWHVQLMGTVCGQLAQTNPALLDVLVTEVPRFVQSPAGEGVRLAACQLAGVLADTMDREPFARPDWEPLLQALQPLCHDSSATVEAAASEATCAIEKKLQQQKKCPASSACRAQGRRGPLSWLFRGRWKGPPGAMRAT